jgi:hypothetical protein
LLDIGRSKINAIASRQGRFYKGEKANTKIEIIMSCDKCYEKKTGWTR